MSGIATTLQHVRARSKGIGTSTHAVQYLDQDYETLKRTCIHSGCLFEDHAFEASSSSLGFKEFGPNSYKVRDVTWCRPEELTPKPLFIADGTTRPDVCQGALGNCWLLAAIASLTLNQEALVRVVPPGQSFDKDYAGIFHFQFWQYGEWVDVVIDDRLPTRNGKLLFVRSEKKNEFWSALLEKAYAKLNGCYEALSGGLPTEAAVDFTGGITAVHNLREASPDLFVTIQEALRTGSVLCCTIPDSNQEEVTSMKLVKGHAYSVTGAEEVHRGAASRFSCGFLRLCQQSRLTLIQLIRIRNPWGMVEWKGPWSDGSPEWNEICWKDRARLRHKAEDGEFWMSFSDFLGHYKCLEICNLSPEVLDSAEEKKWTLSMFEGSWRKGSTAGGCVNNSETFWMNPQFVIKLNEQDDDAHDDGTGCSFVVNLIQKNRRKMMNLQQVMLFIGVTIYKLPAEHSGQRNVRLGRRFFQRNVSMARSKTTDRREVSCSFCLPPGEYVIIPSTFKPGKNGDFCLRVFFKRQGDLRELDNHVESNVKEMEVLKHETDAVFRNPIGQYAAEADEFSAFELRNVLNRKIKCTDIRTEGFSLETCRHMVNLLDKDGRAKLSLGDVEVLWGKILRYGDIYYEKDEDKSHTMSSTEMRQAVGEAGFSLNNTLHQILVARYSNPDLIINFDSFVSCLVRLECMFKLFKMLDNDGLGEVQFNRMEWLSVALL
ncbi:calpain-2 catalytic subunit-like [Brachyhypopomus gauderio]|uniref:calpain-2 catalytic subunit-like n=1 Tax=Brachyhypopomus gauderio TaxID=698409 RepID=UPI0040435CCF